MKRFLLALMLMFVTFTPSLPAEASGSNTVFMPVRATEFKLKPAYRDESFNTSELFNYLESSQSNSIMVARVTSNAYRTAYYYTYWDYDVEIAFADYETIVFTYYPRLGAILGVSTDNDIVVLLPQE